MRVLIATVTAGAGHLAAAAALEEAWVETRPSDVVQNLDLAKFFSALHRKVYSDGYVRIVNRAPELWGLMFNKTDSLDLARRISRIRRLFPSNSRARFTRAVQDFR